VVIPELQKEESIMDLNGNKSSNVVIDTDTVDMLSTMRRIVNGYSTFNSNGYLSTYGDYLTGDFGDYLKQYMVTDGDDLP
jgi:hypothetical protein